MSVIKEQVIQMFVVMTGEMMQITERDMLTTIVLQIEYTMVIKRVVMVISMHSRGMKEIIGRDETQRMSQVTEKVVQMTMVIKIGRKNEQIGTDELKVTMIMIEIEDTEVIGKDRMIHGVPYFPGVEMKANFLI